MLVACMQTQVGVNAIQCISCTAVASKFVAWLHTSYSAIPGYVPVVAAVEGDVEGHILCALLVMLVVWPRCCYCLVR